MQNKYTSIIFFEDETPLKLRMVSRDFRSFYFWLKRKGYKWTAINVYHRNSGSFIIQLRPYNYWIKIESL